MQHAAGAVVRDRGGHEADVVDPAVRLGEEVQVTGADVVELLIVVFGLACILYRRVDERWPFAAAFGLLGLMPFLVGYGAFGIAERTAEYVFELMLVIALMLVFRISTEKPR